MNTQQLLLTSLIAVLSAMACTLPKANGQAKNVPEIVLTNFMQRYPAAEDISWGRDRNDSYEAHFKLAGTKLRADYNPDGTWIETEESVKWDELPAAIQDAIKRDYDKDDIEELERTVSATKGEFWDVEIDPKGEKKFDVEYRADGTVITIDRQ